MWDASTDPAKQRGAHARDLGRGTAAATRAVAGTKPVPRQAFAAVAPRRVTAARSPSSRRGWRMKCSKPRPPGCGCRR
jgi:hypothetical protein